MRTAFAAVASLALLRTVAGADILKTDGFTTCGGASSSIQVQNVDISFDKATNKLVFDVAGSSSKSQEVTASLIIEAYGKQYYNKTFDPCAADTKVDQLCPVPQGNFAAKGEQDVPSSYASQIPSIVYTIPDLDGTAKLILTAKDGSEAACITSAVTNGKSVEIPAVQGVAAAIAAGALLFSGASAALSGGQTGASHSSPGFIEVMWWMQGMAMDGMLSVNYPSVYRSYTKNFGFATGIVSWGSMQTAIDSFRGKTGGNVTHNNYDYLHNATLQFSDGSSAETTGSLKRFAIRTLDYLVPRQLDGITTKINDTVNSAGSSKSGESETVSGIKAYVEQLTVPDANAFMTILMVFAIIIAAIVVGILLFKVILEAWSLIGKFPKSLTTFRKEYWRIMLQTITGLILMLYGVWTLYCIFQFRNGDSWAAKALAGVTLSLFTLLLGYYAWTIWRVAAKLKAVDGDSSALYENKETWKKYKLFYENYKKTYWWLFIPFIVYMFAKGCVIAGGDGNGLVQTIGQLAIEAIMLILLIWSRPYDRKSGNWINIIIQVVRVLSVACILVFVNELGATRTTQTVTGVVLIVVQASLTAVLAILIAINAIINCFRENPHRRRRKALEKANSRDLEGDAFLMEMRDKNGMVAHSREVSSSQGNYEDMRAQAQANRASRYAMSRGQSEDPLIHGMNGSQSSISKKGPYVSVAQDISPHLTPTHSYSGRQPRLPDVEMSHGGYSNKY